MVKILSFHPNDPELEKENPFESLWEEFKSSDRFTKLFIITFILIVFATPFIITNYQLFTSRGESESQRLKSIAQLQEFQQRFVNLSSSTVQVAEAPAASIPAQERTLSPLESIFTFFANGISYLLKIPTTFFSNAK